MSKGDKHSQKRNYMKGFKGSKAEREAAKAREGYHKPKSEKKDRN